MLGLLGVFSGTVFTAFISLRISAFAMARVFSFRLLIADNRVRIQASPVGFVVDKVALGPVSLPVLRFSHFSIASPMIHILLSSLLVFFSNELSFWNLKMCLLLLVIFALVFLQVL
jgi:hypothetical protein